MEFFLATLFSLFSIVDPPGAVPVYISLTSGMEAKQRNRLALYSSFYFLLILVGFFLAGTYILSFFGLTVHSMRIAGGMVLLSTGFSLMGGNFAKKRGYNDAVAADSASRSEIAFTPMAMPLLSGPGSISYLITMFKQHPNWDERVWILAAILAMGVMVYLTLRAAPMLFKLLGHGGLNAIARIMGFLVVAIGVQFIVDGLVHLIGEMG
ncbi:MAG: MarC family protein [Saprospiraceae bacterium]|nr:MarC family protein [Saprospiraceae bacterium]MCF8249575.1 MarC family protein [Saprospiraceae bacterium]MCF8280475.1 MarC family protein [Bacteroidales bacterium]MCF8310407.1 MarC family protein [Saprospiraceae bacterium]MCF8439785.1 MarC family protein [Saprospiraceae bacterium]